MAFGNSNFATQCCGYTGLLGQLGCWISEISHRNLLSSEVTKLNSVRQQSEGADGGCNCAATFLAGKEQMRGRNSWNWYRLRRCGFPTLRCFTCIVKAPWRYAGAGCFPVQPTHRWWHSVWVVVHSVGSCTVRQECQTRCSLRCFMRSDSVIELYTMRPQMS